MRTRLVAAAGIVLFGVGGCSSSGSGSDPDAGKNAATSILCARDATAKKLALPSGFPADFPLPAGTVVTAVDDRGDKDGIVVTGVTPTAFARVLKGLQADLPAKGYTPSEGEVEPHDAESNWTSKRFTGRWAIRELTACGGDVTVSVVARAKT